MSVDLVGVQTSEKFSNRSWVSVLELAYSYGWRPAGVENSDLSQWMGGVSSPMDYVTNGGQVVTAGDAKALADAIELALRREDMSAGDREKLKSFVTLCRSGNFAIT